MQVDHTSVPMINVLSYNSKGLFSFLVLLASAQLAESIARTCVHNATSLQVPLMVLLETF